MTFRSNAGICRSLIAIVRRGTRLAAAAVFAGSIISILGEPAAHAQESRSLDLGAQPGSYACAINSNGMAVGIKDSLGLDTSHAFAWTETGGLIDLGTLGGTFSFACAVNDNGMAAGYSAAPGNRAVHLFVWTSANGIVDIGSLNGDRFSAASAINNDGMVVGTSASHAFVWTQARGLIDIGTFGDGCCSSARAVNALGMVVG